MKKYKAHILIVDDDDRIRELVKQYLNDNSYLVTTANSAEDAKKKVDIIKFDLIVLDIMMPGQTGLEFTNEYKKKIDTPIILLTAKGEASDRIEGLEIGGGDDFGKGYAPRYVANDETDEKEKGNADKNIGKIKEKQSKISKL